jgi:hypothetical protein
MRHLIGWAADTAVDLAARATAHALVALLLATIGALVLLREARL